MMTATYISLLIDKERLMFSERRKKALINVEITLLSPPTKKQYKPTHVLLEKKISRKENKRKNEEKSKPNLFLRCES